jgi:SAM-dependent methyltransferase
MDPSFHAFEKEVEEWHWWYRVRRDILDQQLARLQLDPARARILDVGCGTGGAALTLARHGRAVALDRTPESFAIAMDRPYTHRVVASAAAPLPFADGSFDVVRTERVLQHVADPARVLAEMARVARVGGRIAAAEPDWETLVVDVDGIDRSLVRRILNARCDRTRHGWIGRRLGALFRDARLGEIGLSAESLIVNDLGLADALFELRASARDAATTGAIDDAGAARFVAALEAGSASGRFFAAATGFIAVGTRP